MMKMNDFVLSIKYIKTIIKLDQQWYNYSYYLFL